MTTRVRRQSRRGIAIIWLAALALAVPWVRSGPAFAAPGSFTDPDDVPLRLDLKTISHTDDGQSITYTLETYESYPDEHADFLWSLDQNGDGTADWYVEIVYEGQLIASVNDGAENQVANGSVSRPAPNAIQVSFPASVLQGATAYTYSVLAQTDANNNGEPDPGESDLAPDTGSYEQLLGPGAPQSSTAPARRPAARLARRPAASPAPQQAASPQPRLAASPAPRPAASPAPRPAASPAASSEPQPAASPAPARTPVAAPARATAAVVPRPTAQIPAPAPAAPQPTTLARTGSGTIAILVTGGLLLTLGGLFVAAGKRRPRTAR